MRHTTMRDNDRYGIMIDMGITTAK